MPVYNYKARDKFGKAVSGIMGGDTKDAVIAKLRQMGYTPISITGAKKEPQFIHFFHRFQIIKPADLNMFNREFATLQRAGLPIVLSLNALKEQSGNQILKETIGQIMRDIEGGTSLSSAMEKHPQIFNSIYVNMIKSGEASGTLDETLERLATLGEHEEQVRLRIKAATRYPVIVVTAIVVAFFVLITLVVPRFAKLYSQFTTALPLPTQILLGINYVITRYWWLLLLIVAAFIFGFNKFVNTKKGQFLWDRSKLKLPVFGPLLVKLTMSRFSRLSGTLMRSGIPILQVLELTSGAVGNVAISRIIDNIKRSVTEGRGLVEPMKASSIFPPVVTQMVLVGEESGKVDELLLHVSDYYDSQVDYMINNFITLIEPILILALGSVVLFMALGIFLPIWNLMRLFR